ncbi:MAG TPA: alkaline phosphatase family protein [Methylomirabilota bacterium]|nr:alkaline phosphatase family protein [Methylomirabilota bacterium]
MAKPRVLLIGWDAADWKVIKPLLAAGQMPNLARLMGQGIHGNLATIYPVLSPMLWTSIATGKRAYKHGVHGFSEPLPDGSGVRPISLLSRKTKALWNILNQTGHRSMVVGWWPSHPAEPLNGAMVSNHFQHPPAPPGTAVPMPDGTIHPKALAESLAALRVNPMELDGDFMRLFVPDYEKVDQDKDKRLHTLGKIIAETMSVHAAGTELLASERWDFAAIYYCGIDHFGHAFMSYHPPRLPWVSEDDFNIYQHVIANAYRYHDAMLGTLLGFTDDDTTVILMSDHGFHPDHLRPGYIPAEPAGPAIEHRHFGIVCLKGPALRSGEQLFGAGLLDICPTILTLFGLPAGKDMDGKVLLNAFKQAPAIEPIESWDKVAGDAGTHPPETALDPVASSQAFKQLVDLGYVAPPAANVQETVDECVRELKYNLARSFREGNRCGEAAALAEELWTRWPKEHRFGILLIDCLSPLGDSGRRREAIDELGRRIAKFQQEATVELARREEQRTVPEETRSEDQQRRAQYEERQLRELAYGRPLLLEWLELSQALLEGKPAEARTHLEQLERIDARQDGLSQRIAGALAQLGNLDEAQALLEASLECDPENPLVQAQLAAIHFEAGRFEQSIEAATESLSLLYFQPGMHSLLGQALMEMRRFTEAEQALKVAIAQSPRNLVAHDVLGKLYRQTNRAAEAFPHEGRARAIRHEITERRRARAGGSLPARAVVARAPETTPTDQPQANIPPPFAEVDPKEIITVVSGLPRSGTSLMMQLLAAAGCDALTDHKRAADADNPLGYFEFEKVLTLARDASWIPEARGKVVKIVAQLLTSLPAGEHYQIILMQRDLAEVIGSQKAMLTRQNREGAALDSTQLAQAYTAQLERIRALLERRPKVRVLTVNFGALLEDPSGMVERIAEFLGGSFDRRAAANAVHPELQRQKRSLPV